MEESIEAYKNALRNNPADKEARENLQKALLELKKKTPKKEEEKKEKTGTTAKTTSTQNESKEAEQRLKLLAAKRKRSAAKIAKGKIKTGGGQAKDW